MHIYRRSVRRIWRGLRYAAFLLTAFGRPAQRRLLREVLHLARRLPGILDQPLPVALHALTPAADGQSLPPDAIRHIVDAATAFGAGKPLGICLRRSLLRYHFLRRANVAVIVHFGARHLGDSIGGHAWLTLDDEPYYEHPENYRNYVVMFSFPPDDEAPSAKN